MVDNVGGVRARLTRSVVVPVGVAIAVIGAYVAWLGFQPPMTVVPETQSLRDSRSETQIWGYALTFVALVAVASWFAVRPSPVANSADAALLLIFFADVALGPNSAWWLFAVLLYSAPILAGTHLVAHWVSYHSPHAGADVTHHDPPVDDPSTPDTDEQLAAWRAYRDGVLRPED